MNYRQYKYRKNYQYSENYKPPAKRKKSLVQLVSGTNESYNNSFIDDLKVVATGFLALFLIGLFVLLLQ